MGTISDFVQFQACVFIPGLRQFLPSYLPATTPIPPTSSSKGFQWGAGRTTLFPLNERTLRWSGLEKRPCSSRKSQDTTDESAEGQTSRRSKSQPFPSSALPPTTSIPSTPTPPISFSQPKPRLPHVRLRSITSGRRSPETSLRRKKLFRTPSCLRRT